MNRTILFILFAAISLPCYPQSSRLGAEAGASGINRGRVTPFMGISYYRTDSNHRQTHWGSKLYLQQYSFIRATSEGGNRFGDRIDHKSTFLFLAPSIDFGVGRKQTRHFFLLAAFGVKLAAEQTTESYFSISGPRPVASSSREVGTFLCTPGVGFSQYIRAGKHWDVILSQGANIMIGNLTSIRGKGIHPASVYITAGISRVFHRFPLPPKTERKPFKSRISYY